MFEGIADEKLMVDCRDAVRTEKRATARVLEYLTEVDRRRIWLREGYSSLTDFCIRYLNYSGAEAGRRIQAAHLSERVSEVKPLLENGSLSLTVMSMLAPVLNPKNAPEILIKVVNQSSRAVEKILGEHFPELKRAEILKIELDDELKALFEKAKEIASLKDPAALLKRVLGSYVRERRSPPISGKVSQVKNHTRYVPRHLARETKQKSGMQCSFVGSSGVRCNQTAHLQIDHIRPWARGGSSHDSENLRCLCRAHNLYFARRDFPDRVPRGSQVTHSSSPPRSRARDLGKLDYRAGAAPSQLVGSL